MTMNFYRQLVFQNEHSLPDTLSNAALIWLKCVMGREDSCNLCASPAVNEIIDRDISQLSSVTGMVQPGQDRYGWEQNSSDAALQFCGLH